MQNVTYTWTIADLERMSSDGYVFRAIYTVVGELDGYTSVCSQIISFERPENLIPFESLTEEIVIEWIKKELGEAGISEIYQGLLKGLNDQKNPPTAAGIPWAGSALIE